MNETKQFIEWLIDIVKTIWPYIEQYITESNLRVLIAFVATLVCVQGIKAVLKYLEVKGITHEHWPWFDITLRRWFTRLAAFVLGFVSVLLIVDKSPLLLWALCMGIINPLLYRAMLSTAVKRDWLVVQSVLKMRKIVPVVDDDGNKSYELEKTMPMYGVRFEDMGDIDREDDRP